MTPKDKVIYQVTQVMEDSFRCKVPECRIMLREHAFGLLQLAVELGICDMDDMNQMAKKYPKA